MLKQPNFRGSEAMGTSSSRSKKDNEKECISSEHGRLGWTELVTSTSSRVLREFPDCRKPENSPASCYTLERQTDDPDSPVTFLSIAFEELTSLPIQEIPDQLFNTVQSLDLSNNRFRLYVIRHFPNLRYVDDGPVSPIERERAIASSNTHSSLSAQLGHSSLGSVDEGIDTE
ncbi:uncharacterized protein LOC111264546 isoform X4 [Varroa jacobsoni]|uniref:uncharacterized protein LOC111264546 isoform X4 n=1 Tax=Varroa jacobsoni TaxID=62625 RepID=UPI000BF8C28E|nr:uncharacterized protein LOC111264546 isoform X4 [Varroa jacobsoni]